MPLGSTACKEQNSLSHLLEGTVQSSNHHGKTHSFLSFGKYLLPFLFLTCNPVACAPFFWHTGNCLSHLGSTGTAGTTTCSTYRLWRARPSGSEFCPGQESPSTHLLHASMFTLSNNLIGANFAKPTQPATPMEQFGFVRMHGYSFSIDKWFLRYRRMFLFNCKCESCIAKLLLTNKKQALVLKKKLYYRLFWSF